MATSAALSIREQAKTVGLVSAGHVMSHFYMLALPPLFPLLKAEFDTSWAALGLIMSLYSVATGIAQIPVGIMVDRFGGRIVLIAGMALIAGAITLIGFTDTYWSLLALMMVVGVGNAVYHPANYRIMSVRIPSDRLGRAYSIHTFAGWVGWVPAPGAMLLLTSLWNWRVALIIVGLIGLAVAAAMAWQCKALDDGSQHHLDTEPDGGEPHHTGAIRKRGMSLFLSLPILMLFIFYLLISAAGIGLQTFSVVSLITLYETNLTVANAALTGFFICGAAGVLFGGWAVDRFGRPELIAFVSVAASSVLIAVIGFPVFSTYTVIGLMSLAGFNLALCSPSRDLIVTRIAPRESIGTVFGILSTGFAVGMSLAPVFFGWINDLGRPDAMFWLVAATALGAAATIWGAKERG